MVFAVPGPPQKREIFPTGKSLTGRCCGAEKKKKERAVSRVLSPGRHSRGMAISLGGRLPDPSLCRGTVAAYPEVVPDRTSPGEPDTADPAASCLALLRVGFAEPGWSPSLLVSSYLTVSPLPGHVLPGGAARPSAVCSLWHFP